MSGLRGEVFSLASFGDMNEITIRKFVDKRVNYRKEIPANYFETLYDFYCSMIGCGKDEVLTMKQICKLHDRVFCTYASDGAFVNGQNAYVHFYSIFNEWHVMRAATCLSEYTNRYRRVTIELNKRLSKKLASLPFSSHMTNDFKSVAELTEFRDKPTLYSRIKDWTPMPVINWMMQKRGFAYNMEAVSCVEKSGLSNYSEY